jgi:hypothetical protein
VGGGGRGGGGGGGGGEGEESFSSAPRSALGPTQPPIQGGMWEYFYGCKQPVREADHLFPSSTDVTNQGICTSVPSMLPRRTQGQLYLYVYVFAVPLLRQW